MRRLFVALLLICCIPSYSQTISKYEYWLDFNDGNKTVVSFKGKEINLDIDVSSLNIGFHFLCFRAMDSEGFWSSPSTTMFFKAESEVPDNSVLEYEYWFDFDDAYKKCGLLTDSILNLDIDLEGLNEGMHFLSFRSNDSRGQWSSPQTTYFLKRPAGIDENKIVGYQYWINDAIEDMQFVTIDPQNPFVLEDKLPLNNLYCSLTEENSDSIETETGETLPATKNVIHIRFKDSMGNYSYALNETFLTALDDINKIDDLMKDYGIDIKRMNGSLLVRNAEDSFCTLYNVMGQKLAETKIDESVQRITLSNTGVVIVHIITPDGKLYSVKTQSPK